MTTKNSIVKNFFNPWFSIDNDTQSPVNFQDVPKFHEILHTYCDDVKVRLKLADNDKVVLIIASFIQEHIQNGAPHIQLDLTMDILHEHLCSWLFESWKDLGNQIETITQGWEKYGLIELFEQKLLWDYYSLFGLGYYDYD